MEKRVRVNLIWILKEVKKAIKDLDIIKLRDLSNHTIHDASILQEENSIQIAVIVYALSKIFERKNYQNYKSWNHFYKGLMQYLENAVRALERDNERDYRASTKGLMQTIDNLEYRLRHYLVEVIERSKVHKASRIHEHGVSVGRTAEILGISQYELMSYLGETGIADINLNISMDIKKRIEFARSLF